jgi:hypothetical protein
MATIAEKVYGQMNNEYGPVAALSQTERHFTENPDNPIEVTEFALAFGLAYAMARTEHPFASDEELADMARNAATEAHARFYGMPVPAAEEVPV